MVPRPFDRLRARAEEAHHDGLPDIVILGTIPGFFGVEPRGRGGWLYAILPESGGHMVESPEMTAFKAQLPDHNLAPLWAVLRGLVTREPEPAAQPAIWKFGMVRDQAVRAGKVISAQEAE